jgi:PAS domain S-box-containing protein
VDLDPGLSRQLFERNLDATLLVAADGTVDDANSAAVTALGRPVAELRGHSIREIIPEDQLDVWLELVRRPVSVPPDLGLCMRDAGGHRVPVELTILWVDSEDTRILIVRDLRRAQVLQRELDAARLQLSEDKEHFVLVALAGAAAHELNQPLTSVMGYAELLRRRVPDGDPMAEILDVILSESERMAGLVRKIGRVSKFETKSYLLGSRIVDLDRAGEDRKK